MAIKKSVTHYSANVHAQPNVNRGDADYRADWDNQQKASATSPTTAPQGSITSYYRWAVRNTGTITKKNPNIHTVYERPWELTAHDFKLDIPDCAYINNITVTLKVKVSGTINVTAPHIIWNIYHAKNKVKDTRVDNDGWENNRYFSEPNVKKLSNSWQEISYTFSGKEYHKAEFPLSSLNGEIFGVDFSWHKASNPNTKDHLVSVQWVKCTVDYELADQSVTFDTITDGDHPRKTTAGESYILTANYKNNSNAGCCNGTGRTINISMPPNAEVLQVLNGNYANKQWSVQCTPNHSETLKLLMVNYGIGNEKYNFSNSDLNADYWVYSLPAEQDVGWVTPYIVNRIQEATTSCVRFVSKVMSSDDDTVTFTIKMDNPNQRIFRDEVNWTVDYAKCSDGVEWLEDESSATIMKFKVPRQTVVNIEWTGCFVPIFEGGSEISVQLDNNEPVVLPYTCYPAPLFLATNNPKSNEDDYTVEELWTYPADILYATHRWTSSTEFGAAVIDCSIADFDSDLIDEECTLTGNIWERVNYIGCVPLKYSHFDPKSDYENKEIWESYKNKTYAGKEGSIDEEITLNFRVPPKDVTTLQGLVKLDKPTPINANWKCFEGDALNHRGWAVFSKISAEQTNPKLYKCEGTVRYITHDINTKFQIFKEKQVNTVPMPTIMADTFELGQNLATGLDYFIVDTDGGFVYDETEEGGRNLFSTDNGQFIRIATRNPLSDVSNIRFDWYSTRINEIRENNMSRIFRIRNADGNVVFEYEYTDFDYQEDYVTCTTIARALNEVGGYDTQTFDFVDLRTEVEVDPIDDDTDEEDIIIDVDTVDDSNIYFNEEPISFGLDEEYEANTLFCGITLDEATYGTLTVTNLNKDTVLLSEQMGSAINKFDKYEVNILELDLTDISSDDEIQITFESLEDPEKSYELLLKSFVNEEYILFRDSDFDDDGEEPEYIAPTFDPTQFDISMKYGSSLEFQLNGKTLKVYDAGYNGREVSVEGAESNGVQLVGDNFTFETEWINNNSDAMTEDIVSYIDIELSETLLSTNADYNAQYSNVVVSPFPIPKKDILFTRSSEEGTIYYITGEEPFKYLLEPYYQYHCGTDLITNSGISIFDLNNSYTRYYIENGLVRLGFSKLSGNMSLSKWDIVSEEWIVTHYFHIDENLKWSLESYSDDKIVIKAGTDTYFTIWRGHPYIGVKNPNNTIYIDSDFSYIYADVIDGIAYPFPVIASMMNTDNLLPACIGGKYLDYDCITIDDDDISPSLLHTITITYSPNEINAEENVTFTATLDPVTTDSKIQWIVDGELADITPSPFQLTTKFDNYGEHTVQAVYLGDDDDSVSVSEVTTFNVKAPNIPPKQDTDPDGQDPYLSGNYKLAIVSAPKKFTYKDRKEVVVQLTKGNRNCNHYVVEMQRPDGKTATHYTDSEGKSKTINDNYDVGKYQWGARFWDTLDKDDNPKLIYKALRWIEIEKATPKFTVSTSGKIKKGSKLYVKLEGMDAQRDNTKSGLKNQKITYTIDGGTKKTKTTSSTNNANGGRISISMNTVGTHKLKFSYAGSKNYKAISKTITIKVVK